MSSHFTLVKGGGGGGMDSPVRRGGVDKMQACCVLNYLFLWCVYIYIYICGFYIRLYKYIADLNFWLNHRREKIIYMLSCAFGYIFCGLNFFFFFFINPIFGLLKKKKTNLKNFEDLTIKKI